jgi:(p)ppGpp synthase/HD superfamily hydrolase
MTGEKLMSTLEHAIALAAKAHEKGKPDKGGAPYILHPLRVMLAVSTTEERIAAVLHDVIEDSDWTIERLRNEGFAEPVLRALEALTKREGEDYEDFVRRAGKDPIARRVKLADMRDNCDLTRIPHPNDEDRRRTEKYKRGIAILERLG